MNGEQERKRIEFLEGRRHLPGGADHHEADGGDHGVRLGDQDEAEMDQHPYEAAAQPAAQLGEERHEDDNLEFSIKTTA